MTAGPFREPGQAVDPEYLRNGALRYDAEKGEIVGFNGPYYNNRPLYCKQNTEGAVLTGDRPFVRLIAKPYVHGALSLAIGRGTNATWLHEFEEVESRYRCGRMTWHCSDSRVPGVRITLTAVPLVDVAGFAVKLSAAGLRSDDHLMWSYGGAQREEDPRWKWDPVMRGNPDICRSGDPRRPLLFEGLVHEFCAGNVLEITGDVFRLMASRDATHAAVGRASRTEILLPGTALGKTADHPLLTGVVALRKGEDEWFLAVEVLPTQGKDVGPRVSDPARAFAEAEAYLAGVERVRVSCPDPRLEAAVAAVCHAVDGNCERDPYIFRHGCMAFSCRFVGWRVICGATALGWHERVLGNAQYTIGLQKKEDPLRTKPEASEERLLVHEGKNSRFYGKGSLDRDFPMYDVQTQFFDQTINDWRASADPEMERLLRPALELHCEWMRECFDPDDDGLYESYINTLPTDSVWYNGGGSAEQSAYAYTAHRAAMDLARRAGDESSAKRHQAQAEKIQRAMRELLWVKERGHFGLYREQAGHGRVHDDAWTYSVFLPIDAGLTSNVEALLSLYFTEWGLERVRLPFGGELCQLSNWVPWKWSVRDYFGGDLCHLALAYFQTGLGDEGYELLRGHMLESAFASAVPGGFSHIGAATDFGDNVHMFARTVVEGLFGYVPDYPNGRVLLRPALPSTWENAAIETPDFSLRFEQVADADRYELKLTKAAGVTFRLPIRAEGILRATINGGAITPKLTPRFGCTELVVEVSSTQSVELVIELSGRRAQRAPIAIEGRVGETVTLAMESAGDVEWHDLHGVIETKSGLEAATRANGAATPSARPGLSSRTETNPLARAHSYIRSAGSLQGILAAKTGHHLVLAQTTQGNLPVTQVFQVHITDPVADDAYRARTPREAGAQSKWESVDLSANYNGDVRTIFQQRYLSPRPATCSVQLGVDGYSAWTFPYWNLPPPEIDLGNVLKLSDAQGRIVTPQRVPFAVSGEQRNIAFTSLWDNWPTSVTIPVNRKADTIWLLVAGSTFPMQTRIANAEFRFRYSDGEIEKLELVPPLNFWMLSTWGGCDYSYEHDAYCLPKLPPPQVQLGKNCRAMVLSWKLRAGAMLESVTLETLSQDVVIGLMGMSLETA